MKVLLKVDVDNLGYAGEVYDVADGYGRNYLIPQGLAVKATRAVMRQAEIWRKAAETRRAELRAEYESLSAEIGGMSLTFMARAGETGKLYGSVTTAQIADRLNEVLGTEIDRRKVGIEPLRQLGEHKVPVRLSADFQPQLSVVIEPEGEVEWVRESEEPATSEVDEDAETPVTAEEPKMEATSDETAESEAEADDQ